MMILQDFCGAVVVLYLHPESHCEFHTAPFAIAIITQPKADVHSVVPRRVEGWHDLPAQCSHTITYSVDNRARSPAWKVNVVDLDQPTHYR